MAEPSTGDQMVGPVKPALGKVLLEVIAEHKAQDDQWGAERNHPNVTPKFGREMRVSMADWFRQSLEGARDAVEADGRNDRTNWQHILQEEYLEAMVEAWSGNDEALRGELVQVMTVCAQWIETLDRQEPWNDKTEAA